MPKMPENMLERVRYAWIHADGAMDKVPVILREHVRLIIAGETNPSEAMVRYIAEWTGRSSEWLLTGEEVDECVDLHAFEEKPFDSRTCNECDGARDSSVHSVVGFETPDRHMFILCGTGRCFICDQGANAEAHAYKYPTCTICGHAAVHDLSSAGICTAKGCGCDGPVARIEEQEPQEDKILHLCDRCHGEVYTFPETVISLQQETVLRANPRTAFTFTDIDGDKLSIYPHDGDVMISVSSEDVGGVRVPLGTLEAVIRALRDTGLRAAQDES